MISFQKNSLFHYDISLSVSSKKLKFNLSLDEEITTEEVDKNDPAKVISKKEKRFKKGPDYEFTIKDLRNSSLWVEGNLIVFFLDDYSKLSLKGPLNLHAETFVSKQSVNEWYRAQNAQSVVGIFVPHSDAGFDDCGIFLNVSPRSKIIGPKNVIEQPHGRTKEMVQPSFHIDAPRIIEPNQSQVLTVSAKIGNKPFRKSITAFLEAVEGYLPKTRVELKDGKGTFKAIALGLEPGDTMRIKVGFRFQSGIAEHVFRVK